MSKNRRNASKYKAILAILKFMWYKNIIDCIVWQLWVLKLILENFKGMTLTMPRNEIYEYF